LDAEPKILAMKFKYDPATRSHLCEFDQLPFFPPTIHNNSDHVPAHVAAELLHVGDTERAGHVREGVVPGNSNCLLF
ncbi:MAG: hypothetical protein ACREQA_13485, partial [Candidatus Binatia bacterium]